MSGVDDIHIIFHTLDNPKRILFWTLDEAMTVFILFILGIWINLTFLLLIIPVKAFHKKLKRKFPNSSLKHKLYWIMPHHIFLKSGRYKNLPPSYIQELLL